MNICIDGFGAASLKGTGHYTYTKNLIEGLVQSYPQPDYSIIWQGEDISSNWQRNPKLHFADVSIDRKENDLSNLELFLANNKVSLFHSPNNGFSIPKQKICKYIITVHDMMARTHPQLVDQNYKKKFDQLFMQSLQKSDHIIAVSKYIKWELENYYEIEADKISVIYPWYNLGEIPTPSRSRDYLQHKYGIQENFVLSIGSIHPRKNLTSLIKAFKSSALFKEGLKLVIVGVTSGKRQSHCLELKGLAESLELSDSILFVGDVDHKEVQHFYNGASCLVNISEYEGFPQVCLEAMTLGTPVICSRNSSFSEVVGCRGIYVDTRDIIQIRDAIKEATLGKKQELSAASISESEKFNGEDSLKKLVSVYENVIY